ncbi:MAG: hypothetical protein R6V19_12450 [Armatimonadota bacterium]
MELVVGLIGIGTGLIVGAMIVRIIEWGFESLQLGDAEILEAAKLNENTLRPAPSVEMLTREGNELEQQQSGQHSEEILRKSLPNRKEQYKRCARVYEQRRDMFEAHIEPLQPIAESLQQFETLWFGQERTPSPPVMSLDDDTTGETDLPPVQTGKTGDEGDTAVGDLQQIALASLRGATESYTRQLRDDRQASEQLFQRLYDMVGDIVQPPWIKAKKPPDPDDLGAPPRGAAEVGITGRDVAEAMEKAQENITSSQRNSRRAQNRTGGLIDWITAELLPAFDEALQHDEQGTIQHLQAYNLAVIRPERGTPIDGDLHEGVTHGSAEDNDMQAGQIIRTLKCGYRWQSADQDLVFRKADVVVAV